MLSSLVHDDARCRVHGYERGWWDDGPRACPSSRYRARDRQTSRGRPPSRGHEGRLVSQTQRPLELTDRTVLHRRQPRSRQCFCEGPRLELCIGPAASPSPPRIPRSSYSSSSSSSPSSSSSAASSSWLLPEDRRFGRIVFERKVDGDVLLLVFRGSWFSIGICWMGKEEEKEGGGRMDGSNVFFTF